MSYEWALCYLGTLAFAGWVLWLTRQDRKTHEEIEKLRSEMNALALTVGLKRNMGPPGPGVMGVGR